jgi:transposase-like protein
MSLRKIARIVKNQTGSGLGYVTIYRWIEKFVPQISEFVNSLTPQLSETWHGDEVFVKMKNGIEYKGNTHLAFLWNVMDRKTRFLLSSRLSKFRDADGATRAFREARENAHGQEPESIFADSLRAYMQGVNIAYIDSKTQPKLIRNAGIGKPHATNNRIERLNGTCRERIKVQRGWKSMDSKIPEGFRIHYDFVKPHSALEGMTPAQRANIPIQNNWMTLLEQALGKKESITSN